MPRLRHDQRGRDYSPRLHLAQRPLTDAARRRIGVTVRPRGVRSAAGRPMFQVLRRLGGSLNSSAGSTARADASLPTIFKLAQKYSLLNLAQITAANLRLIRKIYSVTALCCSPKPPNIVGKRLLKIGRSYSRIPQRCGRILVAGDGARWCPGDIANNCLGHSGVQTL